MTQFHASFGARDLEATVGFYQVLFDQPPSKRRSDYAKFELADPPAVISFVLDPRTEPPASPRHCGLRVASRGAVDQAEARLRQAGIATERELGPCCYADQDKVWAVDLDGNRWEVYVFLGDAETLQPAAPSGEAPCCAPECCT